MSIAVENTPEHDWVILGRRLFLKVAREKKVKISMNMPPDSLVIGNCHGAVCVTAYEWIGIDPLIVKDSAEYVDFRKRQRCIGVPWPKNGPEQLANHIAPVDALFDCVAWGANIRERDCQLR